MSNSGNFEVGDIVRLKSGGPAMTIEKIARWSEDDTHDSARCTWFASPLKQDTGVFLLPMLEKVDKGAS